MLSVQLTKHVPSKVTEHNSKDRMKNKLIESLEQKQLGWSPDCVQTTGRNFLDLMTDVLWYTDRHAKTLESRGLAIPSLFSDFSGFNKLESHGHKQPPMEATKLHTCNMNPFSISEEPWLNKARWSEVNQAIKALASILQQIPGPAAKESY